MRGLTLFLVATAALAAIDGTVINRTTGKPQSGATVVLFRLGDAQGMAPTGSATTDASGRFAIDQAAGGPVLLQATHDGVAYSHMVQPGGPATGIQIEVFNVSRQPVGVKLSQHMLLLEPAAKEMVVNETYIFQNSGTATFRDASAGTLKFYLPASAKGIVQVTATAPKGMPIRRNAEKTAQADVYKLDFPIKPGETKIDLAYLVPLGSPATFEGRTVEKGAPTRLIVPSGVVVRGEGVESLGQEPTLKANVYGVSRESYKVELEGTGSLRASAEPAEEGQGQSFEQILPRVYGNVELILALAFSILALGFALLYKARIPDSVPTRPAKGTDERARR